MLDQVDYTFMTLISVIINVDRNLHFIYVKTPNVFIMSCMSTTIDNLFENNFGFPPNVMLLIMSFIDCLDVFFMRIVSKN